MRTAKARRAMMAMVLGMGAMVVTGCVDEYDPVVICHNANCIEPTSPEEDSSMETLEESLRYMDEALGRPVVDGMELDTFWWGEEGQCLFAHDLDHPERAVEAQEAMDLINQVLAERVDAGIPLTRSSPRYTVLIELKGHVGPSKTEAHTEEELVAHAGCGISLGQSLIDGANARGYEVEVVFMSFAPALLEALFDHPGYPGLREQGHRVRLTALQGIPRPLDIQTVELDQFPERIGIDMISAHPHWARPALYHAAESRGMEMGFWMFNIVPETLRAIEVHRPGYITTSQAPSLTSWLER